jgi:hypothetical protein
MSTTQHTSSSVKAILAAAGVRVRVRDFGRKLRVCPASSREFPRDLFDRIAEVMTAAGLKGPMGTTLSRHDFHGGECIFGYR